jgi:hypothetical protein
MTRRRVTRQAIGLSFAAPEVIARRMLRIAAAGANPSAADRREMLLMSSEKVSAFWESWHAMAFEALRTGWWTWWSPWMWWRMAGRGLGPWHRRASANAVRLRGPRRRRRG